MRLALLALAALCLVAAVLGGLMRLALPLGLPWAAANHGALMTGGFLGSVISLERAIALGKPFGYGAPLFAGVGGILLAFGAREPGLLLECIAPLFLVGVGFALVRRQAEAHIVLLLIASLAWLAGNVLNLAGAAANACAAWWFTFLVLTIGAERLEMTRLVKRGALAGRLFHGAVALLVLGAILSLLREALGGVLFGAGLVALAAWLARFDLARRTVRMDGFARYAAVALLAGYAWLAVGGLAWAAMALQGAAWRDAALHALGLGFVFSMILAHAPVVVPVITRRRMGYTPFFYVPLALLHGSLLVRLAGGMDAFTIRAAAGVVNALALLAFIATLAFALSRIPSTGDRRTTTSEPLRR